jgi:hypothetical protein
MVGHRLGRRSGCRCSRVNSPRQAGHPRSMGSHRHVRHHREKFRRQPRPHFAYAAAASRDEKIAVRVSMSVEPPVAIGKSASAQTLSRSVEPSFEERWAARGDERDRAVHRRVRIAIPVLVVVHRRFLPVVRSMNPNRPRPAVLRKGRPMWCNVPWISTRSSSPFWQASVPDSSPDGVCRV